MSAHSLHHRSELACRHQEVISDVSSDLQWHVPPDCDTERHASDPNAKAFHVAESQRERG